MRREPHEIKGCDAFDRLSELKVPKLQALIANNCDCLQANVIGERDDLRTSLANRITFTDRAFWRLVDEAGKSELSDVNVNISLLSRWRNVLKGLNDTEHLIIKLELLYQCEKRAVMREESFRARRSELEREE